MSKQIITVSREFGSGGRTVGKRVAELLGFPYYDKELVKKVALETGFDEHYIEQQGESTTPWRSLFAYAFSGMGGRAGSGTLTTEDFLWAMQCKVILSLAEQGPCVIVGRCADYILRERQDRLSVLVHAPAAFRADRIVRLYGESEVAPLKRLEEKDKGRKAYYKHYTGNEWGQYHNYALSLDTSIVGIERAAQYIAQVAREGGSAPTV